MHRAQTVADFFLCRSRDFGDYLTNLKLQKLLYYAQGWNLALRNEPLFKDAIEAWIHGPVVASVYGQFKSFRWNPITKEVARPQVKESAFLDEILEKYGRFTALDLERMTHTEAPWIEARGGLSPDENSCREIPVAQMKAFFKSRLR
jgi:uncharacterized phage-associated protein